MADRVCQKWVRSCIGAVSFLKIRKSFPHYSVLIKKKVAKDRATRCLRSSRDVHSVAHSILRRVEAKRRVAKRSVQTYGKIRSQRVSKKLSKCSSGSKFNFMCRFLENRQPLLHVSHRQVNILLRCTQGEL